MCVYWFHTPQLSRSLAGASDRSGWLALTTSLQIATDTLKLKFPELQANVVSSLLSAILVAVPFIKLNGFSQVVEAAPIDYYRNKHSIENPG